MKFTRIDSSFAVAPQLKPADLRLVADARYRAVVNNRPDGEEPGQPSSAEIRREAEQLGLRYAYIPVRPGQMTDADARALGDFVEGAEGPVLAFCRSGVRAFDLWKRSRELAGKPV